MRKLNWMADIKQVYQEAMDSLHTSFDKLLVNECTDRCINRGSTSLFTPNELNCLSRCTRTIPKMSAFYQRPRSDSEVSTSKYPTL